MTVYSVLTDGNTSEASIVVFATKESALKYIEEDVKRVITLLEEEDYEIDGTENNGAGHAFVNAVYGTWYSWDIYVGELRD